MNHRIKLFRKPWFSRCRLCKYRLRTGDAFRVVDDEPNHQICLIIDGWK